MVECGIYSASDEDEFRFEDLGKLLGDDAFAVVAVHAGNVIHGDFFGASGLALVVIGAVSETFAVHLANHRKSAFSTLWLSLW